MAENPTILVIGPRWVGDLVMAQCLFSALRERHPHAAIDVMAPAFAAPLLARMPQVRNLIEDPLPRGQLSLGHRLRAGRALRGRYDIAYVMQGNWKSALIPFFAGIARRIGYRKEMRYGLLNDMRSLPKVVKRRTAQMYYELADGGSFCFPQLRTDQDNRQRLLKAHALADQPYVALAPGAEFGPTKRWPPASYAAFARHMMQRGHAVALLGSPADHPIAAMIAEQAPGITNLVGKTGLDDAIDILSGAQLAVTNDSGLMHIAAAVGTPLVAIFGSTSPQNTPPLTDRRELVWLDLECSPCHARQCPLGHMNCLNGIDVDQIAAAADRLLEAAA